MLIASTAAPNVTGRGNTPRARPLPACGERCSPWRHFTPDLTPYLLDVLLRGSDLWHVRIERREPRRDFGHEALHRALALLEGAPVLAGDQQQRAETADLVVDVLDALVDRVGIAADEEPIVDQLLEGEIGGAAAGRNEMLHAAERVTQIGVAQLTLGLRHRVGDIHHSADTHPAARRSRAALVRRLQVSVDH